MRKRVLRGTMSIVILGVLLLYNVTHADNIDPNDDDSQYAWGENVGWFNHEPDQGDGVCVSADYLIGYV